MNISYVFMDEIIDFGVYEGHTIGDVIQDHPRWVRWAVEEIDGFFLSEDLELELEVSLEHHGIY